MKKERLLELAGITESPLDNYMDKVQSKDHEEGLQMIYGLVKSEAINLHDFIKLIKATKGT